jgi:hypothetical protein
VQTPIDERRRIWSDVSISYPAALLEEMVDDELRLAQLGPALERILGGGVRGRLLVDPTR